jgi:hypothetical protein
VGAATSFLVEDFIDAITSQLDRVQDALRIKAVNRPLTYALKDLSLELKVFVELDEQGRVRFRTSSPTETGASLVHLGFTTITKPMIEENTVSLAVSRSPSLEEAGLAEPERRRLERIGVRTVGQLQNLGKSAGVSAISRLTEVSADRLRIALGAGKPRIDTISPVSPPKATAQPAPGSPVKPQPRVPGPRLDTGPIPPRRVATPPSTRPVPGRAGQVPGGERLTVAPSTRLQILGRNLLAGEGEPTVRLNDRPLAIADADDDGLIVQIPHDAESGALEVTLPDGSVNAWSLAVQDEWSPREEPA